MARERIVPPSGGEEKNRGSVVLVPAADGSGWEIWNAKGKRARRLREVDSPEDTPRKMQALLVGLSARHCVTSTFFVPTMDRAFYPDLVFAHLEKRGLATEGCAYGWQVLDRSGGSSLLTVDLLASPFPEELCLGEALGYVPATRLYPIPPGKAVVMKEHGRLLLVAGRQGKMVFSQVLTSGTSLSAAAAQEVNLVLLSLDAGLGADVESGVEVWGVGEDGGASGFAQALNVACEFGAKPGPDAKLVRDGSSLVFPGPVVEYKQRKRRAQKLRTGLLALAAIYCILAMGAAIFFQQRQRRVAQLDAEVINYRPTVGFVQESVLKVQAVEPAFEKRLYPMRQLNLLTSIMPPSGLVLHRYSAQGGNLRIEGLARDPQLAYQLKADVEKHPEFPGYTWEMSPPAVNSNNSASFRLIGKYANAQ